MHEEKSQMTDVMTSECKQTESSVESPPIALLDGILNSFVSHLRVETHV